MIDTAAAVSGLLADLPKPAAGWTSPEHRLAWHARKAELLSRIADDAAENPGLVDPVEARRAAEDAWRRFDDIAKELADTPAREET